MIAQWRSDKGWNEKAANMPLPIQYIFVGNRLDNTLQPLFTASLIGNDVQKL